MNGALSQRMLLAAMLGLGMTAGLSRADDAPSPQPGKAKPAVPPATPAVTSTVVSESAPCEADTLAKLRHPILERLRPGGAHQSRAPLGVDEVRIGCYSHFNDYSCGSLKADGTFVFGSCRQFFGERCIKGPPPFPVEGFDRNWLYPGGVPPEPKKFGKLFGGGCRDCQ